MKIRGNLNSPPRFPDAGWSLPETIRTPEQEELLVDMAVVEANQRQMLAEEALYRAKLTQPAQRPLPLRQDLKHKRCCGRTAPASVG